jgi:hypothetical protein
VTAKERGIYAAMHKYYHNKFPRINKTAKRKPAADEAGLLLCELVSGDV